MARARLSGASAGWLPWAGCLLLLTAIAFSMLAGAAEIAPATVLGALWAFDPDNTQHLITRALRLPRALTAAGCGMALAAAGCIMQGLTRNPLASPGLLGINAGAALAVVLAVQVLQLQTLTAYAWFGMAGALLAALAVYALSSFGRATPTQLSLAGAAVAAGASALTTAVLISNARTLDEVRFWMAGAVAGRRTELVAQAAPFLISGLILSLLLAPAITTLAMGDDNAAGLGMNVLMVKAACLLSVMLLAGGSVALAGPIGFVGLVVPHVVRFFVGSDYRRVLPNAIWCGGLFLLSADVLARMVARPIEIPVGILTAFVGGPFLVGLVLWRMR
jgi:iron complex transport system permease protein